MGPPVPVASRIGALGPAVAKSARGLVEAESSNHIAHGGLANLIDRIVDVLNHDHCLFRIGNMIVSDRRDVRHGSTNANGPLP